MADVDFAVFTSASTVRGFAAAVPDVDFTKVNAVCIGRQTAAEAQKRGMRTWIAEKATLEALVEAGGGSGGEMKTEDEKCEQILSIRRDLISTILIPNQRWRKEERS